MRDTSSSAKTLLSFLAIGHVFSQPGTTLKNAAENSAAKKNKTQSHDRIQSQRPETSCLLPTLDKLNIQELRNEITKTRPAGIY